VIGLDTNVIVRYLAQDDPVQSAKATDLMERRSSEAYPRLVSIVAMARIVWVLERTYGLGHLEIAAAVEGLLQADVLVIESSQEVFTAMVALKARRGAFADALIGALGERAGCSRTLTFDHKARRLPQFAPA